MEEVKGSKINRVLSIYTKLLDGKLIEKAKEALTYGVNERTIQRDIDDIRNFFCNKSENVGAINEVVYDWSRKGYCLQQVYQYKLSNSEILAISKILLDSRAFRKDEMMSILERMINCCVTDSDKKRIKSMIQNEEYYYIELQHKKVFLDDIWNIAQAVRKCNYVEMSYLRSKDGQMVARKVKPVGIMFSEYYFYLIAFGDDNDESRKNADVQNAPFPMIYRIDRIQNLKILDETFHTPYRNRLEEGEFRKRIQFMYGGKLRKIKFWYTGNHIEYILDRLPTAQIIEENEGRYLITAEVFGNGIDVWLRSQGEQIEVVE